MFNFTHCVDRIGVNNNLMLPISVVFFFDIKRRIDNLKFTWMPKVNKISITLYSDTFTEPYAKQNSRISKNKIRKKIFMYFFHHISITMLYCIESFVGCWIIHSHPFSIFLFYFFTFWFCFTFYFLFKFWPDPSPQKLSKKNTLQV